MSARIEWSEARYPATYTETPGDLADGHGNVNDGPALIIGDGSVVEAADREELLRWLEAAAALVRSHLPAVVVDLEHGTLTCPACGSDWVRAEFDGGMSVSASLRPDERVVVLDDGVSAEAVDPAGWTCLTCDAALRDPADVEFEWGAP